MKFKVFEKAVGGREIVNGGRMPQTNIGVCVRPPPTPSPTLQFNATKLNGFIQDLSRTFG